MLNDVINIIKHERKVIKMAKLIEKIVSNPQICSGKPCIKGTRIPVHIILDLLAAGETFEGVIKAYPNISDEQIRACLETSSS